jgi:glycosyltransferase involved in cell wall biosynthesis
MRILMISHLYPSKTDDVNGSFVHSQVKALSEQDCTIKVVAPTAFAPFPLHLIKEKWRRFHLTPKTDNFQGIEVVYPRIVRTPRAALFELSGLNYYHAMKKYVFSLHQEQSFDLIHAQVAYPDGWAAVKLAKKLNLPLVLTLHGQELQKIVTWGKRLNNLVQTTLDSAEAVIVASAKMQALAETHGVSKPRLHLIYNGLDVLPSAELPEEIMSRIKGKKVLLSVGRLEEEKGIQHNLEALALIKDKHPNLLYIIVGTGSYQVKLQDLARSLGIENRVIFAGHFPREKVQAFYENSDVFSLPSRDEAFGIVYLEAMAAGLPVIGTEDEGIAPLIKDNQVGRLVKNGDIPALAAGISELLQSGAGTTGNKGRKLASMFTWEENARKTLEVYKSVSSRGGDISD